MSKSFFNVLFCLVISFCIYTKCDAQIITVKTNNASLVFRVNGDKQLQQVYFGNSFSDTTNYSSLAFSGDPALPTGGMNYTREPAMEVQHTDGNISLQLNYVDSKVEKQNDIISTDINLKDPVYPVYVTLHFKAFEKENVIEAWTTIRHEEKSFITLQRYASSFISLNNNNFYLTHFYGDYATEVEPEEFQLPEGLYNIQTKLGGARATYNAFPFFMISPNNPSTETDGDVFAGTLAWSGNFNL
ncbi:MAG: glycoside hydrolase family 36 N-terminal domain-containing protein, partial [Ginsengibacter sp.]